jgi:integrase
MFRHGLRTAELVALRWQQVDLKAGYLDVHRVKRGCQKQSLLRLHNHCRDWHNH